MNKIKQRKVGAALSYLNIIAKNLVNFMYVPFLLRFVGQADYGLFQMTNSVMTSLTLLSMGFSSAYVRFYMVYKVKKNSQQGIEKLNALYLIIFVVISILALLVGTILILNVKALFSRSLTVSQLNLTRHLMIIMVLNISLAFISSVFDANITVNQQFIFQQTRQLMQTFLVPIICVPLILMGIGIISIVLTQLVVTFSFLIININHCLRKLHMRFNFHQLPFSLLKKLALFSFFIFLNQIVDLVNNNMPNFILGMFQGAKMVATFAIAVQVKNMFYMLSSSLSNVFIPRVNELVSSGQDKNVLTDLMIKVGRIQMTLLLFVMGGFIVVGQYFIRIWAGSANAEAYLLIILMTLPVIVPLSQNVGIEIQKAMNKHIFRSVFYIIFAGINIIITIIGAINFGLIGASMGYVISILCANGVAMNWYYHARMGLNMKRYWRQTLGVTAPFVSVTSLLLLVEQFIVVNSLSKFFIIGIIYVFLYVYIYIKIAANQYEKGLMKNIFIRIR
uniref:O-antigen flippase Wzx n=1 Tax=Loigolactobacillus rennini TaxID=238013 RepID=A0A1K2I9K4_9LACO|nr:O-antigen flippase Wzx [Loigolactobacillus rennini]